MDVSLVDLFRFPHTETLIQLGLAVVLGACVGVEREIRGRAAGLRTMIIVCLGSTLIMIVSAQLATPFEHSHRDIVRIDPGRVAAGVVTGIGFIGAGVILKLGDLVRGVTTAACIWFVAGVGIAIGQRHYGLAITATIGCVAVLWLMQYMDRLLPSRIYRTLTLTTNVADAEKVSKEAEVLLLEAGARVMDLKAAYDTRSDNAETIFNVRVMQGYNSQSLLGSIASLSGVGSVRWT